MTRFFASLFLLASAVRGHLISPGISTEYAVLEKNKHEYIGFPQSALNRTEVEIRMACADDQDFTFEVQFVLRSSPCDKEFFDSRRGKVMDLLQFYFDSEYEIPDSYDYTSIVYYKSKPQSYNCKDANGPIVFTDPEMKPMELHNVTKKGRGKRSVYPGLNGASIDGGAKNSLTSWHPSQTVPVDGIYLLIIKLIANKDSKAEKESVSIVVEWRQPHGYLSAIDYPLLRFYFAACLFYIVCAFTWMVMCVMYYKDILRIQYWIGVVIILGMMEKAMFYSEYASVNGYGVSVEWLMETAEIVSCAKRTMARVLIVIVSLGYGVVKPRLGDTINQVALLGGVYFIFSVVEALSRISKNRLEAVKQKQFASVPLIIVELVIVYWIFSALIATMRTLRMRRNHVKLQVYVHFVNALGFAVLSSVIFMVWSLYEHVYPVCLKDWKELWVDTAFWHVLFCTVLVVIMILWRPSKNNQRYAFTPLLDNSEDECDQDMDELTLPSHAQDIVTNRTRETRASKPATEDRDARLQEDLKWIEDNIPSSLTEQLLLDDEEDRAAKELELAKMQ